VRRRSATRRVARKGTVAICISIGVLSLCSGWYSVGTHFDNRGLLHLQGGTLLFQVVTNTRYDADDFLEHTWYPKPAPRAGLHRADHFSIVWDLPSIHRVFSSAVGEWWLVRIPLWPALLFFFAWAVYRLYARLRVRVPHAAPAQETAQWYNPARRCTRTLVWISAASGVIVLCAWMGSGWYRFSVNFWGMVVVEVEHGDVTVLHNLENVRARWGDALRCGTRRRDAFSLNWTLPHTADCGQSTYGTWSEINVPFWLLFLLTGATALLVWRRRRRHPPGHCAMCGYNLTGNVSGVCPECGEPVELGCC
jgi:hypothetical protein